MKALEIENGKLKEQTLPLPEQMKRAWLRTEQLEEEKELLELAIESKERALAMTLAECGKLDPMIGELQSAKEIRDAEIESLKKEYENLLSSKESNDEVALNETLVAAVQRREKELETVKSHNEKSIDKQLITSMISSLVKDMENADRVPDICAVLAGTLGWSREQQEAIVTKIQSILPKEEE